MAKRLLLIRHAKSDWGNPSIRDFDRPLNKRGNAAAPEMAQRMSNQNIYPDLIVSSPALRALTTAKYFAKAWKLAENDIITDKRIYEAGINQLLNVVNQFDNNYHTIALFGHNPGLTDFANYLSDLNCYNMPTCSIVILDFQVDNWNLVSGSTAEVLLFDYPKSGED